MDETQENRWNQFHKLMSPAHALSEKSESQTFNGEDEMYLTGKIVSWGNQTNSFKLKTNVQELSEKSKNKSFPASYPVQVFKLFAVYYINAS